MCGVSSASRWCSRQKSLLNKMILYYQTKHTQQMATLRDMKVTKTRTGEQENAVRQLFNEHNTYREMLRALHIAYHDICRSERVLFDLPMSDPRTISYIENQKKLHIKMNLLDRMGIICYWRVVHIFYPEYEKCDAMYAKCINDIFDGKENVFTAEHPLVASYIRDLYTRDTCCVEVRSCTKSYLQHDETREWQDYIWNRGVYINGKRLTSFDAHIAHKPSFLNLEFIMKHGVLTTTRGRGRFRDCKTVRFTAVRLTPKSITK
jgi:hypothetical protein